MKPVSRTSFRKGSILVLSLVILSLMLVTSLTVLSSATLQKKAAVSTGNATRSFQTADSAVEQMLYQLYKVSYTSKTLDDFAAAVGASCSNGILTSASGWRARFYTSSGGMTNCPGAGWRDTVTKLKVEGQTNGAVRAVEVDVKGPLVP